jgi:hypothetical protein
VGRGEKSVIDLLAQQHRQDRMNLFWFLEYEPIKQTLKEVEKITRLNNFYFCTTLADLLVI